MTFTEFMEHAAQGFELVGAMVLAVGLVAAVVMAMVVWLRSSDGAVAFRLLRTVAVTPTLESVGVLAIIVLIRTFVSFSLEIEIEGVPPWRRAVTSGATVARRSVERAGAQGSEPPRGS